MTEFQSLSTISSPISEDNDSITPSRTSPSTNSSTISSISPSISISSPSLYSDSSLLPHNPTNPPLPLPPSSSLPPPPPPSSSKSSIKYGLGNFGSNKISFQQFNLSSSVLSYLQNDLLFLSLYNGDDEKLTSIGFCKSVDYPTIPDHIYYEAYFHSLPSNKPIETMHPRYGMIHNKSPSSLILTSFYETIRRKNNNWTKKLIEKLHSIPCVGSDLLIKILEENRHFADIAVQLHYGDEISEDIARYHVDAPNSLLHLGLSIHGERNLLWKGSDFPSENKEDYHVISAPQSAGCLYLSYPVAMQHSPLYPQCNWESRVIAVQSRCLLTQNDLEVFGSIVTNDFPQILDIIYDAIQNGFLSNSEDPSSERIIFMTPNLEEILEVETELRPLWEVDEKKKSCVCS